MAVRHAFDSVSEGIVVRFWQDGTPEIMRDLDAPEVYWVGSDSENGLLLDSSLPWFTVTDRMSGQFGYDGPVMHDSEFISDGMMEDILADYDYRRFYFTVRYPSDPEDGSLEGWVILACPIEAFM